jgi:hypothetical protein
MLPLFLKIWYVAVILNVRPSFSQVTDTDLLLCGQESGPLYGTILFFFLLQIPLILLVKNPTRVLSILGGLFLIALGLLILTPLGFPYSGDPAAPAAQRFMIAVSVISLDLI